MKGETSVKPPARDEAVIVSLKGPAVFSTDFGLYPARTRWKDQPVQIRSDYAGDRAAFIARLRTKFPEPCIKLKQEDLAPATVLEYFDDYDVHFYSATFLYEALGYMARDNEIGRAARAEAVESFVASWIDTNRETFASLEPSLLLKDLFQQKDIDTHSFPFIWDAFRRIIHIIEHKGMGLIPCYRSKANTCCILQGMPKVRSTCILAKTACTIALYPMLGTCLLPNALHQLLDPPIYRFRSQFLSHHSPQPCITLSHPQSRCTYLSH